MSMVNIFAVGNVIDPHIRIEGKCRACQGSGNGEERHHCSECDKQYFPGRAETGDFTKAQVDAFAAGANNEPTPCGHHWRSWQVNTNCQTCDGNGVVKDVVRLSDLISTPGPKLEFIESKEEE